MTIAKAFFAAKPAALTLFAATPLAERWTILAAIATQLVDKNQLAKFAASTPQRKLWLQLAELSLPAKKAPVAPHAVAAVNLLALAEANDRRFDAALRAARKLARWSKDLELQIVNSFHGRLGKQHANAFDATPSAHLANACADGDLVSVAKLLATWKPPVDQATWYALAQLSNRIPARALTAPTAAATYLALAVPLFSAKQTWSQRWKGGISSGALARTYRDTLLAAATAKNAAIIELVTAQAVRDAKNLDGELKGVNTRITAAGFASAGETLRAKFR